LTTSLTVGTVDFVHASFSAACHNVRHAGHVGLKRNLSSKWQGIRKIKNGLRQEHV
jgi:hypothetical protein